MHCLLIFGYWRSSVTVNIQMLLESQSRIIPVSAQLWVLVPLPSCTGWVLLFLLLSLFHFCAVLHNNGLSTRQTVNSATNAVVQFAGHNECTLCFFLLLLAIPFHSVLLLFCIPYFLTPNGIIIYCPILECILWVVSLATKHNPVMGTSRNRTTKRVLWNWISKMCHCWIRKRRKKTCWTRRDIKNGKLVKLEQINMVAMKTQLFFYSLCPCLILSQQPYWILSKVGGSNRNVSEWLIQFASAKIGQLIGRYRWRAYVKEYWGYLWEWVGWLGSVRKY